MGGTTMYFVGNKENGHGWLAEKEGLTCSLGPDETEGRCSGWSGVRAGR